MSEWRIAKLYPEEEDYLVDILHDCPNNDLCLILKRFGFTTIIVTVSINFNPSKEQKKALLKAKDSSSIDDDCYCPKCKEKMPEFIKLQLKLLL